MTESRFTCKYCGSHTGSFEIEFDEWKHKNLLECIGVLKSEIDRLQSEARWIPVSERLPEEPIKVLVYGDGEFMLNSIQDGRWYLHMNVITHWQEPTPPTEG